jgi:hypothetical protein
MSMAQRLRETAHRLIQARGTSVVYRRVVRGHYDTATAQMTNSSTEHPIKAVVAAYRGSEVVQGSTVVRHDKRLQLAALSLPFAPQENDTITLAVDTLTVYAVDAQYAGDVVVTYQLKARKG